LAVSGLSSVSARIKSSCNLTGIRFEMPNVSYTRTLPPSVIDRQGHRKNEKQTIVKGQKNEILTRPESRYSSRPDVFYFLPTAHFLKQLPTHIAHIAKAPRANAETNALSKSANVFPAIPN